MSPRDAAILQDYSDHYTVSEIAERSEVSLRTVYRVLALHREKHRHNTRKHRRRPKSKPQELKPCGTLAAYRRHQRAGEYPCLPCTVANRGGIEALAQEQLTRINTLA